MPSLYSCHGGFVHQDFDAITSMLLIALSWSRNAPGDNMLHIPVGHRVDADKVLKHYAADKNQAIHCMISC